MLHPQKAGEHDPPPEAWGAGVTLYFLCDDARELYAEFVARGIDASPPETAFYGMTQVFVRDPDGWRLCFEHAEDAPD